MKGQTFAFSDFWETTSTQAMALTKGNEASV
jgi:hypothetical protein